MKPLDLPRQREPLKQVIQLYLRRLPTIEDRLDGIRCQQREPQNPTDVGSWHALRPRQTFQRRKHALIELLPLPECTSQRLEHGVVDPRSRPVLPPAAGPRTRPQQQVPIQERATRLPSGQ